MSKAWNTMTVEERFWARVMVAGPEDCWPWTGEVNNQGYGRLCIYVDGARRRHLVHRFALTLAGEVLHPGSVVMHSCDNPPCVNPAHLSVGSQLDNMRDAKVKGRINTAGLALGVSARLERARIRQERKGTA